VPSLSSVFARAGLYWHTLRPLRAGQLVGRVHHVLRRPSADLSPTPSPRRALGDRIPGPASQRSMTGPDRFVFLGVERTVEGAADWNRTDWPKLWLYNLHYFEDLNAQDAPSRRDDHRALMSRWIRENPPATGNGWEPYPLSRRIVAWIKAFDGGFAPEPEWIRSLAIQARALCRSIEWHLLGNHLFENARALIFAGAFFDGHEAEAWLALGRRILERELREQVLDDGGHFELSPMYHAIVLEGVLDLVRVAAHRPGTLPNALQADLRETASRMLRWLAVMSHPDGEIALFGDAAFGIAPRPAELAAYAARLGVLPSGLLEATVATPAGTSLLLPASGYVRVDAGPAVALLDVGEIGPSYLPAHGHADVLGFELSLGPQRVFVDSGTSLYSPGAERLRQRGTAAHNTVEVDGVDSSQMWGAFRVARRAHPFDRGLRSDGDALVVEAAHDGYRRLPGRPVHRRCWHVEATRLRIEDRIEGACDRARARLHLHPAVAAERISASRIVLRLPSGTPITVEGSTDIAIEDATWHPRFGASEPTRVLVQTVGERTTGLLVDWTAACSPDAPEATARTGGRESHFS